MSATIGPLMKWKYALSESQKWCGHVSHAYAAYEMEIRTGWESKVAGTCQQWLCSWNANTHWLRVESGWNMSAMIVVLMKCKYALAESQKWQEHVSNNWAAHVIEIHTVWESKVAGRCQPWLCCLWNGNTHWLRVEIGRNMSATIVLKWKYALAESPKWGEHVSNDCTAHEIEIRTGWESKVARTCQQWLGWSCSGNTHYLSQRGQAGACQPWLCCLWNGNTHWLRESKVTRTCQQWLCH